MGISPLRGEGIKGLLRVTEALKVEPGSHGNGCSLSRVYMSEKSCRENLAYEN